MDFAKLISIAAQKQQHNEKQIPASKMYTTELSAPQKSKKEEKDKSAVVKKYLEEKEVEKRRKEKEMKKQKEAERRKREEKEIAERKRKEEEEKSKRFRIPKKAKPSDSSALDSCSHDEVQNKHDSKSSHPSSSSSKDKLTGDRKSLQKTESSKSVDKVTSSKDKHQTESNSTDKSKHKNTSRQKDSSFKVSNSSDRSNNSSNSKHKLQKDTGAKESSKDKSSLKENSKDKSSSKDTLRDKHSSKEGSREKSSSKDRSSEKSSSKEGSREKSSSKDSSREKSSSKDSSREKSSSKEGSREKSSSKVSSSEKSSSKDRSRDSNSKESNSKNKTSKEKNEGEKSTGSDDIVTGHAMFSNREHETSRWTSKLSAEEQLRIRIEFERKKARLKDSLNKSKDDRISISDGKQPVFSKPPPDEIKKKSKEESEALRSQRKIEERQKKIDKRRLKNEQEIERIMQEGNKDKGDKTNGKMNKPKHRPINLNKNKAPPKMNFNDILKMAQEKAQDPVTVPIQKKAESVKEHRPMTQEEKERLERKNSKEYKDWYKYGNTKTPESVPNQRKSEHSSINEQSERKIDSKRRSDSTKTDRSEPPFKKPAVAVSSEKKLTINKTLTNDRIKQNGHLQKTSMSVNGQTKKKDHQENSKKRQSFDVFSKKDAVDFSKKRHSLDSSKPFSSSQVKSNQVSGAKSSKLNTSDSRSNKQNVSSGDSSKKRKLEVSSASARNSHSENKKPKTSDKRYDSMNENVLICGPSNSKPKVKQDVSPPPPSNPWDRIYGQMKKDNPKPVKKKKQIIEDDSDDLDDDLDGFIDDDDDFIDDGADMDYSKHIRNIFGYDKSKYRYESDYEISNMESNFREQMKEEARSARLGLQEDLEDIRKEEEELRRKALAKKKNAKRK